MELLRHSKILPKKKKSNPRLMVIVQCPNCGYQQKAITINRVHCFNCNKTYTVIPITGKSTRKFRMKSRIVKVIKGNIEQEYYRLKRKKIASGYLTT